MLQSGMKEFEQQRKYFTIIGQIFISGILNFRSTIRSQDALPMLSFP